MSDIAAWLENLGLGKYQAVFVENEIDFELLPKLTEQHLKELGLPLGPRLKLLDAIAALACENSEKNGASDTPEPIKPPTSTQAERRPLTVMFVDLVGSTQLSTQLDPEDMSAVIRAYQNAVTGEIVRFEGHVAKFMGDGVLAYFGWPRAHEDDAERAVRAGLAVADAVAKLYSSNGRVLAARIGIATGLVVVGDLIGEGDAQEETVVGETPNIAARLQALAEPGSVVIAERTRQLLGEIFDLQPLGRKDLRGIAAPIEVFTVNGVRQVESRFQAQRSGQLLPLVGREQELGLLRERWDHARRGEGQCILLSGEAGIGKSRITQALLDTLPGESHIRLRYQCSPYHRDSALYPVIQQLSRAAGLQTSDTNEAKLDKLESLLAQSTSKVTTAAPLIAALLGIDAEARYGPLTLGAQQQRMLTLEVLITQLLGLTQKQPVLFVVEDVHWIDPSTLELLQLTLERIGTVPVLMLLTTRPGFQSDLGGHPYLTRLTLNRLGREHTGAIVSRFTQGKSLPESVLAEITAKTDGVPLFIEELTKTVLESGLLRETKDAFVLDGAHPALAIPASLHDSLLARLDRLSPMKEIAQTAACIGREFSYELLAAVIPVAKEALQAGLDALVDAELVYRRGQPPQARYLFKHALVRDAAYESLLKSKRQQLHKRIAQVLTEQFADVAENEPELLAYHYMEASLHGDALNFWYKAGQLAIRRSAYVEALAHLDAGLDAIEFLPAGVERSRRALQLQTARAEALQATHDYVAPETIAAYEQAREYCRELDDPVDIFPVLRGIFNTYTVQGKHRAARQIAQECLQLAEQQNDDSQLSLAHRLMGQNSLALGELTVARAHCEQALALYDFDTHRRSALTYSIDLKTGPLTFLSQSLCLLGYPEQALAASEDNLKHARHLGYAFNLAVSMFWSCYTRLLRRDYQAAIEQAQEAQILSTERRLSLFVVWAQTHQALAKSHLRQYEAKNLTDARQCIDSLRERGVNYHIPINSSILADAYLLNDQTDAALALIFDAIVLMEEMEECLCEAELRRLQGESLLWRGGSDAANDAEACFQQAIAVARDQKARWWELRTATSLAGLWRDQGKRQKAYDLLAPIYGWFTEGFDTADLKEAKALLDELA